MIYDGTSLLKESVVGIDENWILTEVPRKWRVMEGLHLGQLLSEIGKELCSIRVKS